MNLRRSSRDDRGVSVVIGTVLLIGMVTMSMAVLGAAVLGTDLVDSPPRAEFVYQENGNGTVAIGLTDVQKLTAGGTEIKLEGGGSCGTWGSSGDLEKGAITIVDSSDCPDSLGEGDVLQVIGANVLLDTYQLRGVPTKFDRCEAVLDGNDSITITEEDSPVECDLVGEDGSRTDIEVTIEENGELLGEINTSEPVDLSGGRVEGSIDTEKYSSLADDGVIDGDITIPSSAESETLNVEDALIDGSVETADRSIQIKSGEEITSDVTITGSNSELTLKSNAKIGGDVDVESNTVKLNDDAIIEGELLNGEVTKCDEDAKINGEDCEEREY